MLYTQVLSVLWCDYACEMLYVQKEYLGVPAMPGVATYPYLNICLFSFPVSINEISTCMYVVYRDVMELYYISKLHGYYHDKTFNSWL